MFAESRSRRSGLSDASRSADTGTRLQAVRKVLIALGVVLVVGEGLLQLLGPDSLDDVRWRTFAVERRDARYVTMQPINFDPESGLPLIVYDPDLFWRLRADHEGHHFFTDVRTNAEGLRSPPLADDKPAGERRLVFFGDSVTFGFGVDESDRYGDRIVAELRARHPDEGWVSVNAGVIGYSSFQGLRSLERRWKRLEPDVVVFCFGVNDASRRGPSDAAFHEATTAFGARLRHGLRASRLVCAIEGVAAHARRALEGEGARGRRPAERYLYYPRADGGEKVSRNDPGAVLDHLDAALARCRAADVPFVVLDEFTSPDVPHTASLDDQYFARLEATFAAIRSWTDEHDVPFVSLHDALAASGRRPEELLRDFCHPNASGHAIIADVVVKALDTPSGPLRRSAR